MTDWWMIWAVFLFLMRDTGSIKSDTWYLFNCYLRKWAFLMVSNFLLVFLKTQCLKTLYNFPLQLFLFTSLFSPPLRKELPGADLEPWTSCKSCHFRRYHAPFSRQRPTSFEAPLQRSQPHSNFNAFVLTKWISIWTSLSRIRMTYLGQLLLLKSANLLKSVAKIIEVGVEFQRKTVRFVS